MATAAPIQATPAHNLSQSSKTEAAYSEKSDKSYIPHGDTYATLNYFAPPTDGSTPFNYVESPPQGQPPRNFGDAHHKVKIHDIRGQESLYSLDNQAFAVVSGVPDSAEKQFVDDDSVTKKYYPEIEQLILDNVAGSNKVVIFDHTIRRSNPNATRAPVQKVHIDQTAKAARLRVERHLGDEAERLLQGRYRIINIWRPLNGPVQSSPLALASSETVRDEDVIPVEHRYPDRTGWTAGVKYNEGQKWHYLSGMRNDERLFIECFDSEASKAGSKVKGGRVPHTAFVHPDTPEGGVGRESIEVRALVFGP